MTPPVFVPSVDLLTVRRTAAGRSTRVTAAGEVDRGTAPALAAALERVGDDDYSEVTVDLNAVVFLDATGVRALAAAARRAAAAGGRLRVTASSAAVLRPLQIGGLGSLLDGNALPPGGRRAA